MDLKSQRTGGGKGETQCRRSAEGKQDGGVELQTPPPTTPLAHVCFLTDIAEGTHSFYSLHGIRQTGNKLQTPRQTTVPDSATSLPTKRSCTCVHTLNVSMYECSQQSSRVVMCVRMAGRTTAWVFDGGQCEFGVRIFCKEEQLKSGMEVEACKSGSSGQEKHRVKSGTA
jgi:hypothetical protein